MPTRLSPDRPAGPAAAGVAAITRKCVHCGFCNATCPTFSLLGDERDGPRGRIYMIREMLENGRAADAGTVRHIDRCLSCLACATTCPSGVDYARLVDHARQHIHRTWRRPLADRWLRWLLAAILPYPGRFRLALQVSRPIRRIAGPLLSRLGGPVGSMVRLAPARLPPRRPLPRRIAATTRQRLRVTLLTGCVQSVLAPQINAASARLLARLGCEVVLAPASGRDSAGCCGALTHHMGRLAAARAAARRNVQAWQALADNGGLDRIVVDTSGCGSVVKDYGHLLAGTPEAAAAAAMAKITRDITELVSELGLPAVSRPSGLVVAYHAACSLRHGQRVTTQPVALLQAAGFRVVEPANAHFCCGSAGVYNILQPRLAAQLGARKAESLKRLQPDIIASGNLGCLTQIAAHGTSPIAHTVELLDQATG